MRLHGGGAESAVRRRRLAVGESSCTKPQASLPLRRHGWLIITHQAQLSSPPPRLLVKPPFPPRLEPVEKLSPTFIHWPRWVGRGATPLLVIHHSSIGNIATLLVLRAAAAVLQTPTMHSKVVNNE